MNINSKFSFCIPNPEFRVFLQKKETMIYIFALFYKKHTDSVKK